MNNQIKSFIVYDHFVFEFSLIIYFYIDLKKNQTFLGKSIFVDDDRVNMQLC